MVIGWENIESRCMPLDYIVENGRVSREGEEGIGRFKHRFNQLDHPGSRIFHSVSQHRHRPSLKAIAFGSDVLAA